MNSLLDSELCAQWALVLGHFVWQGVLIAIAAASIVAMLRRASANTRYGVWLAALIVMSLAPLVTFGLVTVPRSTASLMNDLAGRESPANRPTDRIFDGTVDPQSG